MRGWGRQRKRRERKKLSFFTFFVGATLLTFFLFLPPAAFCLSPQPASQHGLLSQVRIFVGIVVVDCPDDGQPLGQVPSDGAFVIVVVDSPPQNQQPSGRRCRRREGLRLEEAERQVLGLQVRLRQQRECGSDEEWRKRNRLEFRKERTICRTKKREKGATSTSTSTSSFLSLSLSLFSLLSPLTPETQTKPLSITNKQHEKNTSALGPRLQGQERRGRREVHRRQLGGRRRDPGPAEVRERVYGLACRACALD